MNFAEPFIRRPVGTSLLALGLLLAGIVAYRQLPVAPLPQVEFPVISVSAALPGASPETMASSVATPLERQFSTIAGLASMTSTNSLGTTQVTLQFDLERDIDAAAQDVQTAITQTTPLLPRDMRSLQSIMEVLDQYSLMRKRPLTLPLVREALAQEILARQPQER